MNHIISVTERIWKLFCSVKLAIYLLIILAFLSILSIYLQELFPPWYPISFWQERLSPGKFNLYKNLGFFNTYGSFWYISNIVLLIINITVCTLNRIKSRSMRDKVFGRNYKKETVELKTLKYNYEMTVSRPPETVREQLTTHLKEYYYRISVEENNKEKYIYATKGGWGRLGSYLTHTGLVLLFIGGIITIIFGFTTDRWAAPGEIFTAPGREFRIKIEDFRIEVNEKGQLKDYICDVSVLENGEIVKTKTIEVNKPLSYKGLTFYQSSYRENVNQIAVQVTNLTGSQFDSTFISGIDKVNLIDKDGYAFKVLHYIPHFMMSGRQIFSASDMPENPAVQIELTKNDSLISRSWAFLLFPDKHQQEDQLYKFNFLSYYPTYETGLQIAYNPGASFMWGGFLLITLGIMFAFYVKHSRIWAIIKPADDGRTLITVAGDSSKKSLKIERELKEISKKLKLK